MWLTCCTFSSFDERGREGYNLVDAKMRHQCHSAIVPLASELTRATSLSGMRRKES